MIRRKGPRPIELHMAYMSHVWHMASVSMMAYAPLALIPFIQKEILARQQSFVEGWKKYLSFEAVDIQHRNKDVFWQEGVTKCFYDKEALGPPVLLIPSLINKSYIMDLLPDFSFFDFLKNSGFSPYLLDWGMPGDKEQDFCMGDYVTKRLMPLMDHLLGHTKQKPIALGYCMGGILLAGGLAQKKSIFQAAGFLACPWDFHTDQQVTVSKARVFYEAVREIIQIRGFLDIDLIQAFFASADPLLVSRKFARFAKMSSEDKAALDYVAVEDWINDGVILSAKVAEECFVNFYQKNALVKNEWFCGNEGVVPSNWNIPTMVVTSKRDKLVPPVSSYALEKELVDLTSLELDTGHIGLMGSRKKTEQLWPQIHKWLIKVTR